MSSKPTSEMIIDMIKSVIEEGRKQEVAAIELDMTNVNASYCGGWKLKVSY